MPKPEIAKLGRNWLLGEVSNIMNTNSIDIIGFRKIVSPDKLVRLSVLNWQGDVNIGTAKSILEEMFITGKDPDTLLKEGERGQISDTQQLEEAVNKAITANAQAVTDYKAGREQALKFLGGQVMKATKGRANPQLVSELLKKRLEEG